MCFRLWAHLILAAMTAISINLAPSTAHVEEPPLTEPIAVAVSVLPQAYFVEKIGGERVEVQVLIPPGASPATHEPTVPEMLTLTRARLYIKVGYPGFPFEAAWFDRIMKSNSRMKVVDMSQGVPLIADDPHIWLSPLAVRTEVENILRGLKAVDPEYGDAYAKNAKAFLAEIDQLDQELRAQFEGLKSRSFMVFHPAWGYFARDYELKQVAVEEHGKKPGPVSLSDVIHHAQELGLQTIFVQPQFDQRTATTISDAINGSVVTLDPLARDWMANLRKSASLLAATLKNSRPAVEDASAHANPPDHP